VFGAAFGWCAFEMVASGNPSLAFHPMIWPSSLAAATRSWPSPRQLRPMASLCSASGLRPRPRRLGGGYPWQRLRHGGRASGPVEIGRMIVERSLEIADAFALRGSDSVHLASALQLRGDLGIDSNEFTFVTSDQELKAAALTAGLAVVDPQEQA